MPSLLRRLTFAWDYFVRGRHRLQPAPVLPDFGYGPPNDSLMAFVVDMFIGHGASAFRAGSWIVIDEGRLFARASAFKNSQQGSRVVLQTDFVCVTPEGEHLIESFAGMGESHKEALMDACKSFQDGSFHVLLVTLLERPCDHVDRELWTVAGEARLATFGWLRLRGVPPEDFWPPVFEGLRNQFEAYPLAPGFHWVRYFYAHIPGGDPVIEVLVDNEPCEALQGEAERLPWPPSDSFYSARLFFTVQDAVLIQQE